MPGTVEVDSNLVAQAHGLGSYANDCETVAPALKLFIQISRQRDIRDLQGLCDWSGDLDDSRTGGRFD